MRLVITRAEDVFHLKSSTTDTSLERKQGSDSVRVSNGQEKVISHQTSTGCSDLNRRQTKKFNI